MSEITQKLINADKEYLWHPFTQMKHWLEDEPLVIDSGSGFYLIDTQGRKYIDGVSSLWCNVHGHNVKHLDNALREQLDKISHSTLLGLAQTKSIELAEKLVQITPKNLKKVFYSDSGATSVEIALKIAYQYWKNIGENKTRFIALENAYHGDTVGSVSVGGMELFHGIFRSLLFKTWFIPAPHPYRFEGTAEQCKESVLGKLQTLLEHHADDTAAIIIEPLVQGAAGMIVHPQGFLRRVRELADQYDTLLICDEVATGFARTGKMFACEHENISPDIICLAKGITGGYLPLAATVTTQKIFDAFLGETDEFKTFYHGHTYTGNALGCAVALASLELFAQNHLIDSLPEKAELIKSKLARISQLPYVGSTRQCGLMAGIELVKDKASKQPFDPSRTIGAKVCAATRPRGAITRPLGDVLILMPPPAIDLPLLEELLDIYHDTIKEDLGDIVRRSL